MTTNQIKTTSAVFNQSSVLDTHHLFLHGLEAYLETGVHKRESIWSKGIAVGSPVFLEATKKCLEAKALTRKINEHDQGDLFRLKENQRTYDEDAQNTMLINAIL